MSEVLSVDESRLVCFLDILGYKRFVEERSLVDLVELHEGIRYSSRTFIHTHLHMLKGNDSLPTLLGGESAPQKLCIAKSFSDSIIIISNGSSKKDVLAALIYAWRTTQFFVARNVPVRGGIAFGECHVDERKDIYCGKAIVSAYDLEGDQDWAGVAVHDSFSAQFPKLATQLQNTLLLMYPVPMKSGELVEMLTLNWRFNLILEEGTRAHFPMPETAAEQAKVERTLKYAEVARNKGCYINDDTLPVELRYLYVGTQDPAKHKIVHGDEL